MAIRERSPEQGDFKFPKAVPSERALTVATKPTTGSNTSRAAERVTKARDPIVLSEPPPTQNESSDARLVDERSVTGVNTGVEVVTWEKGRFALFRAWFRVGHFSQRKTVFVLVAATAIGIVTTSLWKPYAATALELGRTWLLGPAPPAVTKPKVAKPRSRVRRYECWWIDELVGNCR